MMLDLHNCGGIRIKDHATGQMQVFDWGYWSDNVIVGGVQCVVSVGTENNNRMMIPKSPSNFPVLNIDNKVYLEGLHVLSSSGESFTQGGYLGTANHRFDFSRGSDSAYILLPTLGIIPAAYSGGLRVQNLSTPGSQMNPARYGGRYNAATILGLRGNTADDYNYHTANFEFDAGVIMSARVRGAVGYDFRVDLIAPSST